MPHAIRIHQFGGPEVLRWEEVAVRPSRPHEVRLRHTAIGLNYVERTYLPAALVRHNALLAALTAGWPAK